MDLYMHITQAFLNAAYINRSVTRPAFALTARATNQLVIQNDFIELQGVHTGTLQHMLVSRVSKRFRSQAISELMALKGGEVRSETHVTDSCSAGAFIVVPARLVTTTEHFANFRHRLFSSKSYNYYIRDKLSP